MEHRYAQNASFRPEPHKPETGWVYAVPRVEGVWPVDGVFVRAVRESMVDIGEGSIERQQIREVVADIGFAFSAFPLSSKLSVLTVCLYRLKLLE